MDDESSTEVGVELEIESSVASNDAKESDVEGVNTVAQESAAEVKPRDVPQPTTGQKIYEIDPMLTSFKYHLEYRYAFFFFYLEQGIVRYCFYSYAL